MLTLLAQIQWRSIILVGMDSILEALVEVSPDLLLVCPDPVQVTLLHRDPGIHQVLLEELPPMEDEIRLRSRSGEGMIGIVALLGDVLGAHLTIGAWVGWDVEVEARVTSGEEQDIVERGVAVVQVADPGETSTLEAHYDVTVQVSIIRAPRDNGSNLRGSGGIVPAQVCAGIHSDVHHHREVFTWRLLPE